MTHQRYPTHPGHSRSDFQDVPGRENVKEIKTVYISAHTTFWGRAIVDRYPRRRDDRLFRKCERIHALSRQ